MSFINGSLTAQGIQANLPAIGSIKWGPFSIPFSAQTESTSYGPNASATVAIAAGYKGLMVVPNNSASAMMTVEFDLGSTTHSNFISPEWTTIITFDPNNYPSEYTITISNHGSEQCQVILF